MKHGSISPLFPLIAAFFLSLAAHGAVFFVSPTGNDGADGTSWSTAKQTIQAGIDAAAAVAGGEVWVRQGTYLLTAPLGLADNIQLYGGFDGTETNRDQRDWVYHATTIDAQNQDFGIMAIVQTVGFVLDGFILTGGGGNGVQGGALMVQDADPTISNCVFDSNTAASDGVAGGLGGALYLENASPQITNCNFFDNAAVGSGMGSGNGGAVAIFGASTPVFELCYFDGNAAVGDVDGGNGGAVFVSTSVPVGRGDRNGLVPEFTSCFFRGGTAQGGVEGGGAGGAVFIDSTSVSFANCGFFQNIAYGTPYGQAGGGAVLLFASDSLPVLEVINCTFSQNQASGPGGRGGAIASTATLTVSNSIFWDDTAEVDPEISDLGQGGVRALTVTYSNIQGGLPGTGNIALDPLFKAAASGDLSLQYNSPCIDAGDGTVAPPTDMFGTTRPVGAAVDMGYEEHVAVWYVRIGGAGTRDGTSWDNAFADLQSALQQATAGDEVWVTTGVYLPDPVDPLATFDIPAGVRLYGGFRGDEESRKDRESGGEAETVLSGDVGVAGDATDNSLHVVTANDGAVLDGVVIENGYATIARSRGATSPAGMGAGLVATSGTIEVRNCRFRNNYAEINGAAVHISGTGARFISCSFENNVAGNAGGAVYLSGTTAAVTSLTACTFTGNTGGAGGGGALGIENGAGTVELVNCVFNRNTSPPGNGAAIVNVASTLRIVNSTFFDNTTSGNGVIADTTGTESTVIRNSIIWESGAVRPLALWEAAAGTFDVAVSDVMGGAPGLGNIDLDPLFADFVNGDFNLLPGSPCIDAGDETAAGFPSRDMDGRDRFDDPATPNTGVGTPPPDIGAYEYSNIYVSTSGNDATGDGSSTSPYATIQMGIDTAPWMGTVLVADGVYTGPGNVGIDFRGKAVAVMAENTGTVRGQVVIDCGGAGTGVFFRSGEPRETVLEGITIRNGLGDFGGGISCANDAAPTIRRCRIEDSSANFGGGGVAVDDAVPLFSESVIINNASEGDGGGVWLNRTQLSETGVRGRVRGPSTHPPPPWQEPLYENPEFQNVQILANTAAGNGGGMYGGGVPADLFDCVVTGNSAGAEGGGLYFGPASGTATPELEHCLIASNEAVGSGGGINAVNARIEDCMILGNRTTGAGHGGGGAFILSNVAVVNTVIAGNVSVARGGGLYAEGGIPQFTNCSIIGNVGTTGDGAACYSAAAATFRNSLFWNASWRDAALRKELVADGNGSTPNVSFSFIDAVSIIEQNGGAVTVDTGSVTTGGDPGLDLDPNDTGQWTAAPVYDPTTGQTTLTDSTANWAPDEFKDGGVSFNNGTRDRPIQFAIVGNTGTTLTVWGNATVLANGDTYRIWNYHLAPGSPCIDAADGTVAPSRDFEQDPRYDDPNTPNTGPASGSPADIGADEFRGIQTAAIAGLVWDDADFDGVQGAGEGGLQGVSVELLDGQAATVLDSTTTDALGQYWFDNLTSGDYVVRFTPLTDYVFSPQARGTDPTKDSDADAVTGRTDVITLVAGTDQTDIDAGMVETGSIGDLVWDDADFDGIQDAGEGGLQGVSVELLDGQATTVLGSTTTDAFGQYLFDNLPPGDYVVRFTPLPGYVFSPAGQGGSTSTDSDPNTGTGLTSPVAVLERQAVDDVDAGLVETGSIGDLVWDDVNFDGVQGTGENGLAGVTVNLLDGQGAQIDTATTDANGLYAFTDLPPGDYIVEFVAPAG
ncbi:MAG: hypothetical protein GXP31_14015, partial [Kiritimatiellaeota bacterium]|nr:hypothetical protein [Kiritimatiellota bacterium]